MLSLLTTRTCAWLLSTCGWMQIKNKINGANWAGYGFADRPETLTRPSNQLLALKYFLAMENCVSVMYSVDQFSAAAAGWVPLFPASNPDKGKFVNVMTPTFWMGELYGYYALYHEFLDTVDVYGLIAPYNVIAAYARDDMEWANFAFKQVSKVRKVVPTVKLWLYAAC